jgi:Fic family protein
MILELMYNDKFITFNQISKKIKVSERTLKYYIKQLKEKGYLERKGPRFGGYWQITDKIKQISGIAT